MSLTFLCLCQQDYGHCQHCMRLELMSLTFLCLCLVRRRVTYDVERSSVNKGVSEGEKDNYID